MLSLSDRFAALKARDERALVVFFTAGDQSLSELPAICDTLAEGGADAIEIGIPFSDPFGEGPTIQASSQRALENGASTQGILAAVSQVAPRVPMVTMGYYNPALRMGLPRYATALREANVTGAIISDLVPDEADQWVKACQANSLETIFLAAPTSTDGRIQEVCQRTTGFVYAVSRTGVTGAERAVPPEVQGLVERIRARTDRPICVGFGISTPEHVQMVCQVADGAVVGSYLVNLLHREWDHGAGRDKIVNAVRTLKTATRV